VLAGECHFLSCFLIVFDDARARTRELPGCYPFVVQASFIKTIIKQWDSPARVFCKTVFVLLMEHVKKLVTAHFGSFGQGGLEQRVKSVIHSLAATSTYGCRVLMQDHIQKCMGRAEERVVWLLALEDRPFSLNTHYLADYQRADNANLTSAIMTYAAPARDTTRGASPTGIAKVLAGLVEIGMHNVKPEDLAKLIPPDVMEPALGIMADVRAYFQGTSFIVRAPQTYPVTYRFFFLMCF
jgi:hypothetical protein